MANLALLDAVHPNAVGIFTPPDGAHRRWTREQTERALENLCAARDTWPTWTEFEQWGLKGLRKAVDRYGGARWWAEHLGVRYEPRRGREHWDDGRIRRELRAYLRERRGRWPSTQEFIADGRKGLLQAIHRHGGRRRWADEFACALREHWTPERIEGELHEFLSQVGAERWPTKNAFFGQGRGSLYDAIAGHGGVRHWAPRVGLAPRRDRALSTHQGGLRA